MTIPQGDETWLPVALLIYVVVLGVLLWKSIQTPKGNA